MTSPTKSCALLAGLAAAAIMAVGSTPAAAGGRVPCEPMVPKLTAAFKSSTATDADKTKAMALQKTGLAKCSAEKDADAVVDVTAAFKLLGGQAVNSDLPLRLSTLHSQVTPKQGSTRLTTLY